MAAVVHDGWGWESECGALGGSRDRVREETKVGRE